MRSVWLCRRNDVAGNLAVLLAASGVFATGTPWPDLAVAILMSTLYLTATGEKRCLEPFLPVFSQAIRVEPEPPNGSSAMAHAKFQAVLS